LHSCGLKASIDIATMYRLTFPRLIARRSLVARVPLRCSSGSPTAGNKSPDHFTKTGEKAQDPAERNTRGYEYSASGGDDMVAAQGSASFDVGDLLPTSKERLLTSDQNVGGSNDPAASKERAGKGNAVNPLDFSPASPELSKTMRNTVCFIGYRGGEG
jgi:hypothetical protein